MTVVAFRHVPFESLARIAPPMEERSLDFQYVDAWRDGAAGAPWSTAAGLIFLGGPMSANDELPYIREELQVIEQAIARGIPILGICLGAQLIAKALGAAVYRNPVKEIGWGPVSFRPEAKRDRLFAGLSEETVFHWHGETFDLPEGAEWLASSRDCSHQAFRAGSAWAVQFHLEVTPEVVADWCRQDANEGDVRELETLPDPYANSGRMEELSALVFGRWAEFTRGKGR